MTNNNNQEMSEDSINILSDIDSFLKENGDEKRLKVSAEGADLSLPKSNSEKIKELLERLAKMAKSYTLGLDDESKNFFGLLDFLNNNYFFDTKEELLKREAKKNQNFKNKIRYFIQPYLQAALAPIFERQQAFNSKLVQLLNRLSELLGNQRDFNMDTIKSCEQIPELTHQLEKMERRLDDYFVYSTRIAVLEEDIETLKKQLAEIQTINEENGKITQEINTEDVKKSKRNASTIKMKKIKNTSKKRKRKRNKK